MKKKKDQVRTETETIKTPMVYRSFDVIKAAIDEEKRTVPLAFSSEDPYPRWFGIEILDHDKKSVRLARLNNKAPLLKDHMMGTQVGVIESASIEGDRVGRALVRFGRSATAEEEFQDVIDGIRTKVSVAYRIHKMVLEESTDDEDTYRVTDWEPFEISTVSIPADDTVGIGRAFEDPQNREFNTTIERKVNMEPKKKNEVEVPTVDNEAIAAARVEERKTEQARAGDIIALGEQHGYQNDAITAIKEGKSVSQFKDYVLAKLAERGLTPVEDESPEIGLTGKERKRFSVLRLVQHLHQKDDPHLREKAAFELECSKAVADKEHRKPNGAFIPYDVLVSRRLARPRMARDLNSTDDANLIATDHLAGSFIEYLSNRVMCVNAGAILLDGLRGNVSIPRQSGGASSYWVAEGVTTNPTESEPTFDALALSPKHVGTYTEITRSMVLQSSPAVDNLVMMDLARALSQGIDLAALHGTGANNQPTGIAATSGIGAVAGGTNGAAPDDADIIDLETEVSVDNADLGALAYMTNAKVRGKLKKTDIGTDTGQRVWDRRTPEAPLNGYPCYVTNQVSSALTKGTSSGVCSAIFFGNWQELIIAMWGALDILVDPYTYSKSGGLLIRALQSADVGVRHAQSFAAMLDALTA
jgi:HK97 family phage major capsid protein